MSNIPNHVFGDHSKCDSYFCDPDKTKAPINNLPSMKESKVLDEIMIHLKRLLNNADSLILDIDSNIVEQFNSIVAKFIGGKRINYSLGQSYGDRCLASVIQHNTGNKIVYYFISFIIKQIIQASLFQKF